MKPECIFCKIVKGDIPCHQIYENEQVKVFLDVNPVSDGHMLIIPKKHYENIFDISKEELIEISLVSKKMALLCKEKLGATGVNIVNASGKDAQQSVFHIHYHVVPRYPTDGLDLWFHGNKNLKNNLETVKKKLQRTLKNSFFKV